MQLCFFLVFFDVLFFKLNIWQFGKVLFVNTEKVGPKRIRGSFLLLNSQKDS